MEFMQIIRNGSNDQQVLTKKSVIFNEFFSVDTYPMVIELENHESNKKWFTLITCLLAAVQLEYIQLHSILVIPNESSVGVITKKVGGYLEEGA